jgi:hypothetical protein
MLAAVEVIVSDATVVVVAEAVLSTCTFTVAVSPEALAVTVMVLGVVSPAVERTAVAAPLAPVVACVTAMPPESDENVTGTLAIKLFAVLSASAVMVALADPSDGMEVALVATVSAAAVAGGVVVPVPVVPVPVVPVPVVPVPVLLVPLPPKFLLPLQPVASSIKPIAATIDNLRMSFILARQSQR